MDGLTQVPPVQGAQGAPAPGQQPGPDDAAKRAQEEQMRRDLLATVLDVPARERLARIALVGPERARQVEGVLLRMAQGGTLRARVTEAQLIELLEQMEAAGGQPAARKSGISYQRRPDPDDDWDV